MTDNSQDFGLGGKLRAIRRATLMTGVVAFHGIFEASCHAIAGPDFNRCLKIINNAANLLLKVMGVVTEIHGTPPKSALIVSNHCSYADIAIIAAQCPTTFLAKQEVSRWPVIGPTAAAVGTVFVDRDSAESRRASRQRVRDRIAQGIAITVFPEGTTTAGPGTLDFRPGTFATAVSANVPVAPVAIAYHDPRDTWVGDQSFVSHLLERFQAPAVKVSVSFGPLLQSDDVELLRSDAQRWVRDELERLHSEIKTPYHVISPTLWVGDPSHLAHPT